MNEDDKQILKETGRRIATARKKQRMTQVDLAKKMGIPRSRLSCHELGMVNLPMSTLRDYSEALNVSIDYLTGDSIKKNVFSDYLDFNFTDEEEQDIKQFLNFILSKRKVK